MFGWFIRTLKWYFVFISLVTYDQDFISNVVTVIDYCGVFTNYVFFNLFYFCWHMYFQLSIWLILSIMSSPETNCLVLVWWYVLCTAKSAAARMPIYWSEYSTYVYFRLCILTKSPSTWCSIYIVTLTCRSPREAGLVLISIYSF